MKTQSKSKYVVTALSIGIINIPSGKTMYDWSIYDKLSEDDKVGMYLTNRGLLLMDAQKSFEIGDTVDIRNNDSGRLILSEVTIVDWAPSNKPDLIAMLKKNGYDYTPLKAFQARPKYNRTLNTSYSIKGVYNTETYEKYNTSKKSKKS